MDPIEALEHLRVYINVASQSDDIRAVHRVLRKMRGVVNEALPPVWRKKAGNVKTPHQKIRSVVVK